MPRDAVAGERVSRERMGPIMVELTGSLYCR